MSMWASSKSCSSLQPGAAGKDAFAFMVTPDTIPQFIIPPLDIQEDQRIFSREKMVSWRSHKWHSLDEGQRDRKAWRSHSDPIGRHSRGSISCAAEVAGGLEGNPDPVGRSALSLLHLAKITTPYGFVTLGESPQVTHEESLFFHLNSTSLTSSSGRRSDTHQIWTKASTNRKPCQNKAQQLLRESEGQSRPCQNFTREDRGDKTPSNSEKNTQLSRPWPTRLQIGRRNSSPFKIPSGPHGLENSAPPERKETSSSSRHAFCRRRNSFPKISPRKSSRNLFEMLMKKHFSRLNTLKSSNKSKH